MKVYTKTGDQGTTSLVGGSRVPKNHPRIEAYGTIDELMAFTALLSDQIALTPVLAPYQAPLTQVLDHLMRIASHLATEGEPPKYLPHFDADQVVFLEQQIDTLQATLPAISRFTLPGGHPILSHCHICRTVCRRAERRILTLMQSCEIRPVFEAYVNRLSDYFYVLGRRITLDLQVDETLWEYEK